MGVTVSNSRSDVHIFTSPLEGIQCMHPSEGVNSVRNPRSRSYSTCPCWYVEIWANLRRCLTQSYVRPQHFPRAEPKLPDSSALYWSPWIQRLTRVLTPHALHASTEPWIIQGELIDNVSSTPDVHVRRHIGSNVFRAST